MIAYLHGRLVQRDEQGVTVEVAGVGYRLLMATASLVSIGDIGSTVTVYTLLQIRDDAPVLFGFAALEEKSLFEKLTTVTGVGPKVALSALSTFAAAELARRISEGDVTRIATIPGIGKKTAQRIVLELKGILELDGETPGAALEGVADSARKDATDALLSMGFTLPEIQAALKGYAEEGADSEALLRYAFKRLGG